jgi:hypothetical protein
MIVAMNLTVASFPVSWSGAYLIRTLNEGMIPRLPDAIR